MRSAPISGEGRSLQVPCRDGEGCGALFGLAEPSTDAQLARLGRLFEGGSAAHGVRASYTVTGFRLPFTYREWHPLLRGARVKGWQQLSWQSSCAWQSKCMQISCS